MRPRLNEIAVLVLILAFSETSFCAEWLKNIVPGVIYTHIKTYEAGSPLHIHILKIDLGNDKVDIRPELAGGIIGGLERTSSIAARTNAVAAINGSFFEAKKKLHLPIGFMVIDGQVVGRSVLERAAIGIKADKKIVFGVPKTKGHVVNLENKKSVPIWGVNRPRKKDEVVIYTNEYGATTRTNDFGKEIIVDGSGKVIEISPKGDSPIPANGFVVSLHGWSRDFVAKTKTGDRIGLSYDLAEEWKDVRQAVTGGPLLLRDGETVHEKSLVDEKFIGELLPPNSRTAIGITKDKQLLLVVVDKRSSLSKGVTYDELAGIMKEAGATDAIGLDGGHASTMYLDGKIVNYPLTGREGEVSNAIIVTYSGWHLASIPKAPEVKMVYSEPSRRMLESIRLDAELLPSSYFPQPEDYGIYGLYDLYNGVSKPVYFY